MQSSGTRAELEATTEIPANGFRMYETDTAVMDGNLLLYYWKTGNGTLPYAGLSYEDPVADPLNTNCDPLPPVIAPCADVTGFVRVEDEDGTFIENVPCGTTYVIPTVGAMPFIHYANRAAMVADNVTIPTDQQEAVDDNTKNRYIGDNVSTVSQLVAARKYNLGVEHVDPAGPLEGLDTVVGTNPASHIQLN